MVDTPDASAEGLVENAPAEDHIRRALDVLEAALWE